jgi:hypothetical protein
MLKVYKSGKLDRLATIKVALSPRVPAKNIQLNKRKDTASEYIAKRNRNRAIKRAALPTIAALALFTAVMYALLFVAFPPVA